MSTTRSQLVEIVGRHLSRIHAESLVRRAVGNNGANGEAIPPDAMPMIVRKLSNAARLFLPSGQDVALSDDLKGLLDTLPEPVKREMPKRSSEQDVRAVISISQEEDILVARSRTREMCLLVRANPASSQKAATIVSELTRNIVSYTPGGELQLVLVREKSLLCIQASDTGTGISNLSVVMSGNYASRTGLGMGLLGSKRLADRFDIQTGSNGTRIVAEVQLR